MKELDSILERINAIQDTRKKEITELEQKIADMKATLHTMENERAAALESGNMNTFSGTSAKIRDAADMVDIYQKKLTELRTTPLLDKASGSLMQTELLNALQTEIAAADTRTAALVKEMTEIHSDITGMTAKVNDTLRSIQVDLVKDDAVFKNGHVLDCFVRKYNVEDDSLIHFLNQAVNSPYSEIHGLMPQKGFRLVF